MADIPWAEIAKGTAVFVAGAAGATVGVPAVLGVFGFGAGEFAQIVYHLQYQLNQ